MPKAHFLRRVAGWILTLVIAYSVFVAALMYMQPRLMYFPDPAKFVPSEWALKEMQPLPVETADGLTLTSWYYPAHKGKFTIVFFQGNAGHLGYRNYKVRPWLSAGYGVLMIGYRGFGNPGLPSEKGLYMDARAAINALHGKGIKDKDMVFYGESLGTGVAVQMATEFDVAGLILESPLTSVADVAASRYHWVPAHLLLRGQFDSLSKIKDVHMPLLLMHGEADQVIPAKFGHELLEAANEPKQGEFIPDVGHNDVYTLRIQELVLNFIGKLPIDGGSGLGARGSAVKDKGNDEDKSEKKDSPSPEP